MKVAIRLAVLFAVTAILPRAFAADVSGNWKGDFDFQGTSVELTFHLRTAGSAVTGTVEGLPTSPAEIEEGKVDGDTLTFTVSTDYEGQTYRLLYKGKVAPDAIDFSFATDDGSWGTEMTAKRSTDVAAVADVGGDWAGSFDFQGTTVPLSFHLKSAGKAVTGTVEGLQTSPAEIHDGKVDGDTLTFWLDTDYEGQTYQLAYTGKIAGDHIDFTFGTEDGSWGATLTAQKVAAPPVPTQVPAQAPAPTSAPAAAPATAPAHAPAGD